MATRAVLGMPADAVLGFAAAGADFAAPPVISSRTFLTMSANCFSSILFSLHYRMHRLSHKTHLRRFVNVAADVRPSPVRLAIVKVQNPSPPNPIAE